MTQSVIRDEYHRLVRRDVFPILPRPAGKLLDVGGGVGATSAAIKKMGQATRVGVVDLVDPEVRLDEIDFSYSGDLEHSSVLEDVMAAEGPFDTILCLDVLEHMHDPWALIAKLHRGLAAGGTIVASIPNVRHYSASFPLFFSGKWELRDAGILDRTHLRFFVRETAVALMTSSGLQLEEVQCAAPNSRLVRALNAATLKLFNDFATMQYLIRVRRTA